MLQNIRDRLQGILVAAIIGLLSLTFVLWGVQSYFRTGARVIVAKAGGQDILLGQFQDAMQRFRRQAQAMMGDQFNASEWNTPAVKKRALDQLINDRLLARLIDKSRIRISDQQLAAQIQSMPSFEDAKGRFSRRLYEQRVPVLGFTPAGFERQIREDVGKAQLRAGIALSEFVTRQAAERVQSLREQKRDVGYAIIPASAVAAKIQVGDGEIQTYFADHHEDYRVPDKVTIEYLQISRAALADSIKVTDEKLRKYYDDHHAAFTAKEERNVNHILIHVAPDASPKEVDAAKAKAEKALARAKAGEPFEKLAKELSDDTGTSTEGGETGFFARGVMAPAFEKAAFALQHVGDISAPVRTKFGFHIIKLKAIKPGGLKPFDAAKADVETAYRASEAEREFADESDKMANLVYEHPESLQTAADALKIETKRVGPVTKEELAKQFSEKLASAVFDSDVLVEGMNSDPVDLKDGRVVAARVIEHKASFIPKLADVRAQVAVAVREEHQREMTEKIGKDIIAQLRKGDAAEDVMRKHDLTWRHVEGATRDSGDANRAVMRAAFTTAVAGTGPAFKGIPIGNSDYAVIRISNVVTPKASELDKGDLAKTAEEMEKARENMAWRDFVAAIRASSDVTIYPKHLE